MKKILFWGLLLLAAACFRSSEEPDFLFSPNAPEPSSSWVRSQDDALETLAAMLENLEGSESTRAASVRQIRSSVLAVLDETVLTPDDLTRSLPDGAFHD